MFDKTTKIPRILLFAVMGVSILVLIGYLAGIIGVDGFIGWSYVLLGGSSILAIVFPFMNLFTNIQALKRVGITVIGFAILIGGAYAFASDTPIASIAIDHADNIPSKLKFAGTGLFMTYFLLAISVGGILFSEISKKFK